MFPALVVLLYFISLFGPVSGGGATGLERRRLHQLISPVCVRFNNICVTQEARWAWTTPRCASASSGGLSWTTRCSRTLHCRAAHYVRELVITNILVLRSSRLRLCSTWACLERHPSGPPTHRFNDRQVWSCSSCCRRNLSAAYSHYQQPCVKEPSVDNFREAMHGDAARTAALLLMIACSTDAPAAIRCPG